MHTTRRFLTCGGSQPLSVGFWMLLQHLAGSPGPTDFSWHKAPPMLGNNKIHLLAPRHAEHMSLPLGWKEQGVISIESAGEMAQSIYCSWSSVPGTYAMWLTISCNSSLKVWISFLTVLQTLHTHTHKERGVWNFMSLWALNGWGFFLITHWVQTWQNLPFFIFLWLINVSHFIKFLLHRSSEHQRAPHHLPYLRSCCLC